MVRLDSFGELDEYFADGAHVHIERMDTRSFWIGLDLPGDRHVRINTGVSGNKWYFNVEEDWAEGKTYEVNRPSCHRKHSRDTAPDHTAESADLRGGSE